MTDQRPPVWVGHISLKTDRLDETEQFMRAIGMRFVFKGAGVVVLELRGGTHLVLAEAATGEFRPTAVDFDLMVDDLDGVHRRLSADGANPGAIKNGRIHRSFVVREPAGNAITFINTHVSDQPV